MVTTQGPEPAGGEAAALDLDRVVREIEEEVRARRASGEIPPDLERELDLVFARFSPTPASTDGLEGVIQAAEAAAFVDVDVPTGSRFPGVSPVKRTLRKLTEWYMRYLAQQVSAFATSTVAGLRLLHGRVEKLEAALPAADPRVVSEARMVVPVADVGPFENALTELLTGLEGRVLVAECGDGSFLRVLVDHGIDAYGVDPHQHLADLAANEGLEVRGDETLRHLRSVAEGTLQALVLSGCVDRLALGGQLELADLATAALADGGRLAVVGTAPAAWVRAVGVVASDLTLGRPLHAATWIKLLERRGLQSVRCHVGPVLDVLPPVEGAEQMNANLARIEEALFGPASFAVTGTRSR